MQKFIIQITEENAELIQDSALECYLLTSSLSKEFMADFAQKAAAKKKLVLVEGLDAANLCKELNLDGAIIDLSGTERIKPEFEKAKRLVGSGKSIGLIIRNRRHEAMVASECEPDFVIFQVWNDGLDKMRELVNWYSELFLIQSAVICRDDSVDFKSLEADIVILNDKSYKILVAKKQSLD